MTPFAALAFKIMTDPFVGSLDLLRVYSGVLKAAPGAQLGQGRKRERVGRMLQMHANSREDIKEAHAGDIIASPGLKNTTTATRSAIRQAGHAGAHGVPEPVIEVAVEPKTKGDQEKMGVALAAPCPGRPLVPRDDRPGKRGRPSSRDGRASSRDHLVDRMKREFKVDANVGAPQVAYRETITRPVEVDYTHKKQTGGSGQFARVKIDFEPRSRSRASSSRTRSSAARCRGSTSRVSRRA